MLERGHGHCRNEYDACAAAQVEAERAKQTARARELAGVRRGGRNALFRLLDEGVLRAGYALSDHTRNALILAIFGFKVPSLAACVAVLARSSDM